MKKYLPVGALLINTIIWGGTFTIIKNALEDASSMIFVAVRFSLASLILLPFVWKYLKNANRDVIISGFILGFLLFLGFASQTMGLKYTTATKSGFITGLFVIFTPILQTLIEKRKPTRGNMLGIVLVLAGLILLSGKGDSVVSVITELGSSFNRGDFLTLLCAFFFAMYIVYLDMICRKYEYMLLVFLQIAVTAILGYMAAFLFTNISVEAITFNLTDNLIYAFLYTAILATIVTTIIHTKYQRNVSPTQASIIFSLEPIFAAIIAFYALGETITPLGYIGCGLIFIGLLFSELIGYDNK